MRVLLVAPRTNLLLADEEVQDILRSSLDVTPLIGNVTSTELMREIKNGEFDVLWLATHGEVKINAFNSAEHGIVLSDGFMSASELVAQVRGRFSLVFLNTCTSFHIAQQIQEEANVSVVGTIIDVPDRQAYQTGSLFASWLASGLTPPQAYRRSKPGGARVYMYLASLEPSTEAIDILATKIDELTQKVQAEAEASAEASQNSQKALKLYRRLLYISLSVHVLELPALLWLAWLVLQRG